ncbi:MAG: hypothetical protein WEC84_01660 [Candidatus Andersenbacteria bacterium]
MTLIFVVMFTIIFIALSGLTDRQFKQGVLQSQDELAFQIAEAGLNYGRWRLAHDGADFTNEVREVEDQFAGVAGSFEVSFEQQPGSTLVMITSTGTTSNQPAREATVKARYGIPSLARYALVTNSDVFYASQVSGEVHANGGVRMDGTSDSVVSSAKETYICQPHHGCNYEEKPGVWGSGEIAELWEYPKPPVDYSAIALDLLAIKDAAEDLDTYYGPLPGNSGVGYHITFNSNNTYSIYRVKTLQPAVYSWFEEDGSDWVLVSHDINTQQHIETKAVPSNGVIFVEDTLWIDGAIRDRVTVAAGAFPDSPSTNVDIILNGNITYGGVRDGSRALGVVAQRHVLIPWSGAPNVMTIEGAFLAQKGRFGRRRYNPCCGGNAHNVKSTLNIYGMIGSNLNPATAWTSSGTVISGFQNRNTVYDNNMIYGPPPYFPTSGQYEFISWEQVE